MATITAIYENGVFRPTEPVDLPEGTPVEVVLELPRTPEEEAHLDRVYEIMSRRYKSGHHDTAERHNEHQP
jgi:predicted DNA-binding antitoxin AbrB/MazE fold protein